MMLENVRFSFEILVIVDGIVFVDAAVVDAVFAVDAAGLRQLP